MLHTATNVYKLEDFSTFHIPKFLLKLQGYISELAQQISAGNSVYKKGHGPRNLQL